MYLDFFDGMKQPALVPHLDCLMYFPENYRPEPCRQNLDNADVVVIEISSLKMFRYLDHHYQLKMVGKQNKLAIMDSYSQPLGDLAADLALIQQRISKPIIFTGHVDLDFYDVPGVHGHIAERGQIDAVLQQHCANFISLKKLFRERDYKTVCDFSYGEHDTHHITNTSKQLLRDAVVEKCRQLGLPARAS